MLAYWIIATVILQLCVPKGVSDTSKTRPINSADYLKVIRQDFARNWFKSSDPLSKYNDKNIEDVFLKGFRNLRLRSRAATDTTRPISPAEYQKVIGQGFATNWFKSEDPLSKYNDKNIEDVYSEGFRNLRLRFKSEDPLSKYNDKNIEDVYSEGFRNLRLRSDADLYTAPYSNKEFKEFLSSLTKVVDKCLKVKVAPIITWIHHEAEACGSDEDRQNYVAWWKAVAKQLKDKDYRLSFNLFTELGTDGCGGKDQCDCKESLRMDRNKYNQWTAEVVKEIRATGGNNKKRIIILGSPVKTAKGIDEINPNIYKDDPYIMVEWHVYASGPNQEEDGQKYWRGDGTPDKKNGRDNVKDAIKYATEFTKKRKILTYLGAWMPADNDGGSLTEEEVISFGRFFAEQLKKEKIPWSLNVLDRYYDTKKKEWITGKQEIQGASLNMSKVLENIKSVM